MLRKSQIGPDPAGTPVPELAPDAVLVDMVVLTADPELFQATRVAVGERNPVWRARSADEAADLLITGRCGVLVVDTAAVSHADTLIQQIVEQFPDVVVCVAGTRDDEPLLAPLISNGLVYRFMHKPASARRAGMFLQAAIRRHVERRDGKDAADPLTPILRGLQRPTAGMPRGYLALIGLVALALTVPLFLGDETPTQAIATMSAPVAVIASSKHNNGRADPVLSRARAALQAGRLEAPEARNALDLFQAVLLAQPGHPEAQASLVRTVDLLLARAQQEAEAGRHDEAERLVRRVLSALPGHEPAQALARRINADDTPSQQLSREQEAEVEGLLAASALAADETTGGAPTDTRARTLEEIQADLAALPGPVTRLDTSPKSTSTTSSTPAAPVPVVRPDPLAPRVVNPTQPAVKPVRSYAREPVNVLPTAGMTGPTARRVAEPPAATTAAMAPGVVTASELVQIVTREPVYPAQALRNGTKGWVELEFTVTSSGLVRDVQVVAAEPRGVFDVAASDAVAAWRFRPRVVNGRPMAQRSTVTMRFDVDS